MSGERDAGPCSQASKGAAGTEDAVRERTGMFASAWFTLAALSDGADAALARRIIKAHGGRVGGGGGAGPGACWAQRWPRRDVAP